jgi:hypothetical protein
MSSTEDIIIGGILAYAAFMYIKTAYRNRPRRERPRYPPRRSAPAYVIMPTMICTNGFCF